MSYEDLIEEFESRTHCDSASMVVYDDGKVIFIGDNEGLYQIGSMTKAFTGLGIMKLVNENKISLEDKVSDYIPGFTAYYQGEEVDITIKNLMTMKSGFTNSEKDYPSATFEMSLEDWAYSMAGKELQSQPGSDYSYSNTNFNLLGRLIEIVSNESYKDYMEKEILSPLGLHNTTVGRIGDNIIKGSRLGYLNTFAFEQDVKEGAIPAGYFYSNTGDMERWIEIQLGNADVPEEFYRIISDIQTELTPENSYFAGWEYSEESVGHSGGTANYSSRIVFSADENVGVCFLTNLNVAASTDRTCNDALLLAKGQEPMGYVSDVWSLFDGVFTGLTELSIIMIVLLLVFKNKIKRAPLIAITIAEVVFLLCILIIIPVIFQASWGEILLIWGPWSMMGGLLAFLASCIMSTIITIRKSTLCKPNNDLRKL